MNNAIHEFYESFFPNPSQFEKRKMRHLNWGSFFFSVFHNAFMRVIAIILAMFCGTFLFLYMIK